MNISNYDDLLAMARQQAEPQRMLFVFTKADLPEEHSEIEAQRFNEGQGGNLVPVVSVDKGLDELSNFPNLVEESRQIYKDWKVVFIAALAGKGGVMPSHGEVEHSLEIMIDSINQGKISQFLAFDQEANPLQFF
ncbi:ribonucleotide reductase subunit alpha [Candidatus Thiomargarita nelsonii]|uniref:Ribonucleotide reductase subunit alpha n=1 Tax=Candidatus Thiomargarita nelsonii TaxID=1003181 RepID=A0A4E0QMN4_9GAMM|nr:ribonucleotide reductase subunit alpha [Candidatus Thiomargarita nelsonii]